MKKLFLLLPCITLLVACEIPQVKMPKVEYKTIKLKTEDVTIHTSYSASLQGQQDVDIIPQATGTLMEIKVKEGQTVHKGQPMFVIDQVPSQAELRIALADVKVCEAQAATAKIILDSKKDLYSKKIISDIIVKQAQNEYATALASIDQAQARVTNANQTLSFTVVKAPCNGIVGDIPYRVGSLVSPSINPPLTTVSNNGNMYAYLSLTEAELLKFYEAYSGMSLNDALKKLPKAQLRTSIGTMYPHLGTVESVSGVINRNTGTMTARAIFPNPNGVLRSGGSAEVVFPAEMKNVIVIPQGATRTLQDKILAYKVVNNKAKSVAITVIPTDDNKHYIVTEGLAAGDVIVADGAGNVKEGEEISFQMKM